MRTATPVRVCGSVLSAATGVPTVTSVRVCGYVHSAASVVQTVTSASFAVAP